MWRISISCQPLLHQIQITFRCASEQLVGWIPTCTQLGYALGMLFLSPWEIVFERRGLIFISTIISAVCLVGAALSPNIYFMIGLSLLIGLTTMAPQYIIPFAANLSAPEKRGHTVGMVMSGLLLGILLARYRCGIFRGRFRLEVDVWLRRRGVICTGFYFKNGCCHRVNPASRAVTRVC